MNLDIMIVINWKLKKESRLILSFYSKTKHEHVFWEAEYNNWASRVLMNDNERSKTKIVTYAAWRCPIGSTEKKGIRIGEEKEGEKVEHQRPVHRSRPWILILPRHRHLAHDCRCRWGWNFCKTPHDGIFSLNFIFCTLPVRSYYKLKLVTNALFILTMKDQITLYSNAI